MTEAYLQTKCVKYAKTKGIFCRKLIAVGQPGFPDLFFIGMDGVSVFVELKTPVGRLRPKQKRTIEKMREAGALVYIIKSYEAFVELIDFHTD